MPNIILWQFVLCYASLQARQKIPENTSVRVPSHRFSGFPAEKICARVVCFLIYHLNHPKLLPFLRKACCFNKADYNYSKGALNTCSHLFHTSISCWFYTKQHIRVHLP